MTIQEKLLAQVVNIRGCMDEYKSDAKKYAEAKNDYEMHEAKAGCRIIEGYYYDEETGEQHLLNNDAARKAYLKDQTVTYSCALNLAKEMRDASAQKVEVERSILSVLKEIAGDENFDQTILGNYEI